jgi:hypothetical protein
LAAQAEKIKHLHTPPDSPWLFKRDDLEGLAGHGIVKKFQKQAKPPRGARPPQKKSFISIA